MAMAEQARNTSQYEGDFLALPMKAGGRIFAGTLVALDATGHAVPATKAEALLAAGRAEKTVDNRDGDDGALYITAARGAFKWSNDAANPVTIAHVMKPCYMLDDGAVTALETGSSVAGKVLAVSADSVIVETI